MPLTTGAVSLLGSRPGVWRQRAARPFPTYRGRAARVVRVDAGVKYKRDEVEVNRQIGEGSFGIVYQGKIDKRKAGDVVLKRPKLTVEGAAELQEVEAWMNDRVSRDARGACADFLGSFRVTPDEAYLNVSEGVIAKEGLWLVWKYEGDRTLAQYMAQPDYPMGIANALLGREGNVRGDAVVELEVTQAAIDRSSRTSPACIAPGLVHRDIKPHNLVLTDNGPEPRFKLIDLGACACFRTGMNFAPDETIMDPKYAPPEEYLIGQRTLGHSQTLRSRGARGGLRGVATAQARSVRHVQRRDRDDAAGAAVAAHEQWTDDVQPRAQAMRVRSLPLARRQQGTAVAKQDGCARRRRRRRVGPRASAPSSEGLRRGSGGGGGGDAK